MWQEAPSAQPVEFARWRAHHHQSCRAVARTGCCEAWQRGHVAKGMHGVYVKHRAGKHPAAKPSHPLAEAVTVPAEKTEQAEQAEQETVAQGTHLLLDSTRRRALQRPKQTALRETRQLPQNLQQ